MVKGPCRKAPTHMPAHHVRHVPRRRLLPAQGEHSEGRRTGGPWLRRVAVAQA